MSRKITITNKQGQNDARTSQEASLPRVKVIHKGGPGSGHHGHSGRPGKVGGSQPGKYRFPGEVDSVKDLYWDSGWGSGYFIWNNHIIDSRQEAHIDYLANNPEAAEKMGIKKSDYWDIVNLASVPENLGFAYRKLMKVMGEVGLVRVRDHGKFFSIMTGKADTATLRYLQRMYDKGLFDIKSTSRVLWEGLGEDGTTRSANVSLEEFLSAKYVTIPDRFNMSLKNLVVVKGGPGSGHHGHSGRPGKRGGSLPGKGISIISSQRKNVKESLSLAENCDPIAKQCWRNSVMAMPMVDGAKYVEGQFVINFREGFSFPVEHGWLEKEDGTILDVTLPKDQGTYIKAREYSWDEVWDHVNKTGGKGSLPITSWDDENWIEATKAAYRMVGFEYPEQKGGDGSGHFGHRGRPGKVGGSLPGKGVANQLTPREIKDLKLERMIGRVRYENRYEGNEPWLVHGVLRTLESQWEQRREGDYNIADSVYIDKEGNVLRDENGNLIGNAYDYYGYDYVRENEITYEIVEIPDNLFEELLTEVRSDSKARMAEVEKMLGGSVTEQEVFGDIDITQALSAEDSNKIAENLYYRMRDVQEHALEIHSSEVRMLFDSLHDEMKERYPPDSNERINALYAVTRGDIYLDDMHEFEIMHQVALGNIDPEDGRRYGHYLVDRPQGKEWTELPQELWHVTTNAQGIIENGIKSRIELGQRLGLGLGGGQDNSISFTTDFETAKNIERTIHEAHLVAKGDITIENILENAMTGARGVGRNFVGEFIANAYGTYMPKEDYDLLKSGNFNPFTDENFQKLPWGIKELILAERGMLEEPMSAKNLANKRWDVYRDYLRYASHNGGYDDPLFFGTDYEGLAKLNPDHFAILKYKPRGRTKGYQMGSLAEWRTIGGDVVQLEEVIDYIKTEDFEDILGIIKKALRRLEVWADR